ncbi:hypothetical protein Tco_0849311 [Tanacetum coccineum]
MPQPMQNLEDSSDLTTAMNKALALLATVIQVRQNVVQYNGNEVGQNAVHNPDCYNFGSDDTVRVSNMGLVLFQGNCKSVMGMEMLLQTPVRIAQEEEAGIQSTQVECEFMAAADAYEETKKAYANCTLENNLQQASTSGTQSDKAPVYDSDGSAEVHLSENCYNNDIFNMFTQEEQYTELLEPIPEPHQVQQNDSNVICLFNRFLVWTKWGTVEKL